MRKDQKVAPIPYTELLQWTPRTAIHDPAVFETVAHPQKTLASTVSKDRLVMTPQFFFSHRNGQVNYLNCLALSSDLQTIKIYHRGMKSLPDNEEMQMKGFIVDGNRGERIVGIEVEVNPLPSSLRVRTPRQMCLV